MIAFRCCLSLRTASTPFVLALCTALMSAFPARASSGEAGHDADAPVALFNTAAVAREQALDSANAPNERGLARSALPNRTSEIDPPSSPERNIERAMSKALSPPMQRCAALNAAINQAVMDKHGSRAIAPDSNGGWHPRWAPSPPGPSNGRFADKQARLEAEYSKLGCGRSVR